MPVLPIRISGDPVLHTPAEPVGEIDAELRQLVADMVETMHAAPGVGLAGPQVGVGKRLFVWSWTDENGTLSEGVAIDPQLLISTMDPSIEAGEEDEEGCLSIPGQRYPLQRADRALLRARGLDGTPYEIEADGWLARIFQHEYDHLDGVLYADRLEYGHHRSVQKVIKKRGWGVPGREWLPGRDNLEG